MVKIEVDEQTLIEIFKDYITTEGLPAFQKHSLEGNIQQAQIDGWATLHTLLPLLESQKLQPKSAIKLVHEALDLFGECPQSNTFNQIKEILPEAFVK